jgi:hypothetical protein
MVLKKPRLFSLVCAVHPYPLVKGFHEGSFTFLGEPVRFVNV